MKYLVVGSEGRGFETPQDAINVLESIVLPGLDAMTKLESEKRILAGGVQIGDRAVVFVADAPSNEKLDRMLREIPLWGVLKWHVTPLESFDSRATEERQVVARLKGQKK